jgi:hypothetical protein
MIGRAYLERGARVVVIARWANGGGPRNVLIRRGDGSLVVRPFRGLRSLATSQVDARRLAGGDR